MHLILNFHSYYFSQNALQQIMGPYLAKPATQKTKLHAENLKLKLKFSRCEMQGWRRTMEDAAISELDIGSGNSLFAVFDGHGGPEVAKFVERTFLTQLKSSKYYKQQKYEHALIETFRRIDQIIDSKEGQQQLKKIRKKIDANSYNENSVGMGTGCTACAVLITPTKIITANAGDSRAVLCRSQNAVPLSFDHKPTNDNERRRILAAGGDIQGGRINGSLNLSRSLGDFNFKRQKNRAYDEQLVISRPDVTQILRAPEDQFIIIGCDGIWERYVKDSQLMITKLINDRKSISDGMTLVSNLLDSCLAKDTEKETGCDNMTAILVEFM